MQVAPVEVGVTRVIVSGIYKPPLGELDRLVQSRRQSTPAPG